MKNKIWPRSKGAHQNFKIPINIFTTTKAYFIFTFDVFSFQSLICNKNKLCATCRQKGANLKYSGFWTTCQDGLACRLLTRNKSPTSRPCRMQ